MRFIVSSMVVWPILASSLRLWLVIVALPAVLASGCAYRFTNDHIVRPEGIETVAVEAVYDTSREVLPHEMLWQALQDAVGASGYVRLAPQSSADAIIRAHIKEANITPLGSEEDNGKITKDPDLSSNEPPRPSEFQRMSQASKYRPKGRLGIVVEVEVWSLRTRTLLMKRTYPVRGDFYALHLTDGITTRSNDYLRYQEALDATFATGARAMSQRVIQDLFVN